MQWPMRSSYTRGINPILCGNNKTTTNIIILEVNGGVIISGRGEYVYAFFIGISE